MNPLSHWLTGTDAHRPPRHDDPEWRWELEDPERGDVPGWVLITLMTAALVAAIWAVAGTRLVAILNEALDRVSGI